MAGILDALSFISPLAGGINAINQYNKPQQERSGFGNFLFGSPEQFGQMSSFSPENQEQFNQLISQLLQGLSSNQFDFGPVEQQARSNFAEQTVPSIAERFTSMGGGGGRSSAFGQQLGAAGAGLERDLASQRQGFNMQQQGLNQNLMRLGQQTPFYSKRQPGMFESMAGQIIPALGTAAGGFAGGPAGAMLASRLFGGQGGR